MSLGKKVMTKYRTKNTFIFIFGQSDDEYALFGVLRKQSRLTKESEMISLPCSFFLFSTLVSCG